MRKIANPDDTKTIVEYLIRYANVRPKLAMDRLMKVELIRNNFSKNTIYNLCIGTRSFIKEGKIHKAMPKHIIEELKRQTKPIEQTQIKETPIEETPILTPAEQSKKAMEDYQKVMAYIDDRLQDIDNRIDELTKEKIYWQNQQATANAEFQKINQEILQQGYYKLLEFVLNK